MTRLRARLALRHLLVAGMSVAVIGAAAGAVGLLWLTTSMRAELERGTQSLLEEQQIAEAIVTSFHRQWLAGQRYLQSGHREDLAQFEERGAEVYRDIRRYLFHPLPMDARLRVERVRELHQDFEVAANEQFQRLRGSHEDVSSGASALAVIGEGMGRAMEGFVETRRAHRESLRVEQERRLHLLYLSVAGLVILMLVWSFIFANVVHRRILVPLAELSEAAERLGDGLMTERVVVHRHDEMGAVAERFNQMADRIQATREEIAMQNEELLGTLDRLQHTQQQLVQHEKLSAMGEMLAGLAHELNNPLTGVLGMAEILHDQLEHTPLPEMKALREEIIAPMLRETRRSRDLVRNLLQFSRMSTAAPEVVQLADAVNVAAGLRRHEFITRGRNLSCDVPAELTVYAEPQRLQHALVNLINNALDAIVEGGGSSLRIRAFATCNDWVTLLLEDDGPGFRDPDRALQPFYTTKAVGSGTGLGLTLTHRFVLGCGGEMAVRNREYGGAEIEIRLRAAPRSAAMTASDNPARRAAEAEVASETSPRPGAAPAQSSSRRGDAPAEENAASAATILVVDDEPTLRDVQRRLLARRGYTVLLAATGAEARDTLERDPSITAVITDIRMPGEMDGVALYRWIAVHRTDLAARCLFVTGDVYDTALLEFMQAHPDRLLAKPFDARDYMQRVAGLLAENYSMSAA